MRVICFDHGTVDGRLKFVADESERWAMTVTSAGRRRFVLDSETWVLTSQESTSSLENAQHVE